MAFTTNNLVQTSNLYAKFISGTTDERKLIWQYSSSTDDIAAMMADDYFKTPLNGGLINAGDIILLKDTVLSQLAWVILISTGTAPSNVVSPKLAAPFTTKAVFTSESTDTFAVTINGVAAGDNVLATIESTTGTDPIINTAIASANTVTITLAAALVAEDITFNVLVQSNS